MAATKPLSHLRPVMTLMLQYQLNPTLGEVILAPFVQRNSSCAACPAQSQETTRSAPAPPRASRSRATGVLGAARRGPPSRCLRETHGHIPGEEASAQRPHRWVHGGVNSLAGSQLQPAGLTHASEGPKMRFPRLWGKCGSTAEGRSLTQPVTARVSPRRNPGLRSPSHAGLNQVPCS